MNFLAPRRLREAVGQQPPGPARALIFDISQGTAIKLFRAGVLFSLLVSCGFAAAFAEDTASISGTVRDATGAAIAGAKVRVSNAAIGVTRTVVTNSEGDYLIAGLPSGSYRLTISARGFKEFDVHNVALRVAQKARLDATLDLGAIIPDYFGYATSDHEVSDVFFLDSSHGWMTAEDHEKHEFHLFRSNDGGRTWMDSKAPEGVFRIYFIGRRVGWALSRYHTGESKQPTFHLWYTTNGGRTWKRRSRRPLLQVTGERVGDISEFAFSDNRHGWLVGSTPHFFGLVLKTSDGGKTVHELTELSASISGCSGLFARQGAGVWIYGYGFVLHSSDEGKTSDRPLDPKALGISKAQLKIHDGFFWPNGRGWLVGSASPAMILGTEDFGRHWRPVLEVDSILGFDSISSWDSNHACAADLTLLYCTSDGGSTWQKRDVLPPADSEGQAVFFPTLVMLKSGQGWALRAGGYLYQTADGGQTWHEFDPLKTAGKR